MKQHFVELAEKRKAAQEALRARLAVHDKLIADLKVCRDRQMAAYEDPESTIDRDYLYERVKDVQNKLADAESHRAELLREIEDSRLPLPMTRDAIARQPEHVQQRIMRQKRKAREFRLEIAGLSEHNTSESHRAWIERLNVTCEVDRGKGKILLRIGDLAPVLIALTTTNCTVFRR